MADTQIIHCSYHKCLTVYYRRVMHSVFNRCLPWSGGYRHFNSHLEDFYREFRRRRVASINNRMLDLARLGDFRISRFVRDPRDLVVSGYFYHRRGAEAWVRIEGPTSEDWYFANATVPEGMRGRSISLVDYLQSLPQEEGLLAEMEVRQAHFESMNAWPDEHPRINTFRYEDIIGDEARVFGELFDFYGLSAGERWLARLFARRYAIRKRTSDPHVRNPKPGQWRQHFTPHLQEAFETRHPGLVSRLGYASD